MQDGGSNTASPAHVRSPRVNFNGVQQPGGGWDVLSAAASAKTVGSSSSLGSGSHSPNQGADHDHRHTFTPAPTASPGRHTSSILAAKSSLQLLQQQQQQQQQQAGGLSRSNCSQPPSRAPSSNGGPGGSGMTARQQQLLQQQYHSRRGSSLHPSSSGVAGSMDGSLASMSRHGGVGSASVHHRKVDVEMLLRSISACPGTGGVDTEDGLPMGQEVPRTLDGSHISRLDQMLAEVEDTGLAGEAGSDEGDASTAGDRTHSDSSAATPRPRGEVSSSGLPAGQRPSAMPRRMHTSTPGPRGILDSAASKALTMHGVAEEGDSPQTQTQQQQQQQQLRRVGSSTVGFGPVGSHAWRASATGARGSVEAHERRLRERAEVTSSLRAWADGVVATRGPQSAQESRALDGDELDCQEEEEERAEAARRERGDKPDARGLGLQLRAHFQSVVAEEVTNKLVAAKVEWEKDAKTDMDELAYIRVSVKTLKAKYTEVKDALSSLQMTHDMLKKQVHASNKAEGRLAHGEGPEGSGRTSLDSSMRNPPPEGAMAARIIELQRELESARAAASSLQQQQQQQKLCAAPTQTAPASQHAAASPEAPPASSTPSTPTAAAAPPARGEAQRTAGGGGGGGGKGDAALNKQVERLTKDLAAAQPEAGRSSTTLKGKEEQISVSTKELKSALKTATASTPASRNMLAAAKMQAQLKQQAVREQARGTAAGELAAAREHTATLSGQVSTRGHVCLDESF
ncbi:MAG: hypothetical protein WDW36_001459 [Sanguina aurantia]